MLYQRSLLRRPISKIRMILLMDTKIWMTYLIIMFAVCPICVQDSIFIMSSESPEYVDLWWFWHGNTRCSCWSVSTLTPNSSGNIKKHRFCNIFMLCPPKERGGRGRRGLSYFYSTTIMENFRFWPFVQLFVPISGYVAMHKERRASDITMGNWLMTSAIPYNQTFCVLQGWF